MSDMGRVEWRDLADSEIRARLENRGVEPFHAAMLASKRDHAVQMQTIERILNG